MMLSEFKIGNKFRLSGNLWMCTDVGTRVVVAIQLDSREDKTWFDGPPYAVAEHTLDQFSQKACEPA